MAPKKKRPVKKRPVKKRPTAKKHLTPKQSKFCVAYTKNGGNACQAYRDSYSVSKMTEKTIRRKAQVVMTKGIIRAYIQEFRDKAAKVDDISVSRVLAEEKLIAFADPVLLFELKSGTLLKPMDIPENIRRAISGIEVIDSYAKGGERIIKYKYKLWDKGRSLERVEKILGMYEKDNRQKNPMQFIEDLFDAIDGATRGLPKKTSVSQATAGQMVEAEQPLLDNRQEG